MPGKRAKKKTRTSKSKIPTDEKIGRRIRLRRLQRRLTLPELGNALRPPVSSQQIFKYEAGENHLSWERIAQVCRILKIDLKDLLGLE
jgi:transcriptional regulator with XRE-family HTH domain